MTNKEILQTAITQSAMDLNCAPEDLTKSENVIVASVASESARKYLELPFVCDFVSYGTNIVASIDMQYRDIVKAYTDKYAIEHCFETPNMQVINDAFAQHGMKVCFMAEYWLPDVEAIPDVKCKYELRVLTQTDFESLYLPQWSNALCADRKHLDVLGVGAYSDGRLVGLAGCSADCDTMWQIGVDVLPEFRRQGVASALTSRLAREILQRGRVPFYCCAWSNIKSARNAIKSGFRPAWAEMTVKPTAFVDNMNK